MWKNSPFTCCTLYLWTNYMLSTMVFEETWERSSLSTRASVWDPRPFAPCALVGQNINHSTGRPTDTCRWLHHLRPLFQTGNNGRHCGVGSRTNVRVLSLTTLDPCLTTFHDSPVAFQIYRSMWGFTL